MSGGESTWSDSEDPHAKVIGSIFFADNNSAGNTFDGLIIKFVRR
jgi:hypothetical protein